MSDIRSITDAEWEAHKLVIDRLYQNKTLSEVMAVMEQDHGFAATFIAPVPSNIRSELTPLEGNLNTSGNSSNGNFQRTLQVTNGNPWPEK